MLQAPDLTGGLPFQDADAAEPDEQVIRV